MKRMHKIFHAGMLSMISGFVLVGKSFAASSISTSAITTASTFGDFDGWTDIVGFLFNVFVYLGWAGVFIGIGFVLFSLIYKLMNSDNEEAMKTVQGYITKAILIVIAGLLLVSIGFIIKFVAGFLGVTAPTTILDPTATP